VLKHYYYPVLQFLNATKLSRPHSERKMSGMLIAELMVNVDVTVAFLNNPSEFLLLKICKTMTDLSQDSQLHSTEQIRDLKNTKFHSTTTSR
jgi:hypothetical protein